MKRTKQISDEKSRRTRTLQQMEQRLTNCLRRRTYGPFHTRARVLEVRRAVRLLLAESRIKAQAGAPRRP